MNLEDIHLADQTSLGRAMSKKMSVMLEEKNTLSADDSDGTPAIAGCVANGIP